MEAATPQERVSRATMPYGRSISTRARDARRNRHRSQGQQKQQPPPPPPPPTQNGASPAGEAPAQTHFNGLPPSHKNGGGSTSPTPVSPTEGSVPRRSRIPVDSSSNTNLKPNTSSQQQHHHRPPLVSPVGAPPQPWEELPSFSSHQQQPQYYSSDRSVASERVMPSSPMRSSNSHHHHHSSNHHSSSNQNRHGGFASHDYSSNRSVVSDTYLLADARNNHNDEEIPMDERSADIQSFHGGMSTGGGGSVSRNQHYSNHPPSSPMRPTSVELRQRASAFSSTSHHGNNGSTNQPHHSQQHHVATVDDDVSSLGGVEDSNVGAMTAALRSQTTVLHGLSPEESILWDTVQSMLQQERKPESNKNTDVSAKNDDEVVQLKQQLAQQQKEQDRAMRAIQRVLADVSQERDRALAQVSNANVEEKKEADESTAARERDALQGQLKAKDQELGDLEQNLEKLKTANDTAQEELEEQKKEIANLKRQMQLQRVTDKDADGTDKESKNVNEGSSSQQPPELQKQLDEKSNALENAKMIITSLENASGSLASDTRLKIKNKDTQIANLKTDVQHYKKKLDTLATELRESQRLAAESEEYKNELYRQSQELTSTLESSLADLRSASVILETTHDPSSIQNLPELFADCSEALRLSIDVFENSGHDSDSDSVEPRPKRQSEASAAETQALKEELQKIKEEALHYRLEAERIEKQRDHDVKTLYAEIQLLRVECTTNMDVLAKKERELAVLRDSLKVEDDEVGYISDDASDGDDEEDGNGDAPPPPGQGGNAPLTGEYGPTQAEALATLLAHGNAGINSISGGGGSESLKGELAQARVEKDRALKELKTEKESLVNAKMIISSLEKANKSMMEDLRSRLHDSNTAIASLLEKSMESEKTTAKLQAELEVLRMEKAKNEDAMSQQHERSVARVAMATETID